MDHVTRRFGLGCVQVICRLTQFIQCIRATIPDLLVSAPITYHIYTCVILPVLHCSF